MPEETKIRINGLTHASSAETTDRYPIDNENGQTMSVSGQDIADMVGSVAEFSDLDSEDKTLVGAINEALQGGGGGGSSTFAGLTDVAISDPTDGQVPKYNATTRKWENANESGGSNVFTITRTSINPDTYDKTATEIYNAVVAKTYSFVLVTGAVVHYGTRVAAVNAYSASICFDSLVTDFIEGTPSVLQIRLDVDTSLDTVTPYESLIVTPQYYEQSGTLVAGQTSITLTNCSFLSSNSLIEVYTSVGAVPYTSISADTTAHTITVTFEAQLTDLGVKARWTT